MPVSVSRRLCPVLFDSTKKGLEKLNANWTTQTACGGATHQAIWGKSN